LYFLTCYVLHNLDFILLYLHCKWQVGPYAFNKSILLLKLQGCRWHKQCRWRASRLAGDGWAVQVRVFTLHTAAGWAWWRVSVRPQLGTF